MAKALVDVATAWLGGIRGSLGLVTVVACTLFAAICGSVVATALAMGTILLPAMIERGYPRSFALGVIGASGTIGIVIPPSPGADPVRHRRRAVGAAVVSRRHSARPAAGGGVLRLGLVRRAAAQLPGRAGAAAGATAAGHRCARCRRWRCRWWCWSGIYGGIVTVTEAAALAAVGGAAGQPDLLSRLPLDPDVVGDRRRACAAPGPSC